MRLLREKYKVEKEPENGNQRAEIPEKRKTVATLIKLRC